MQETERVTSSGAASGSHVQLSEVQLYFNTFILSKAVSVCVCTVQNDQECALCRMTKKCTMYLFVGKKCTMSGNSVLCRAIMNLFVGK